MSFEKFQWKDHHSPRDFWVFESDKGYFGPHTHQGFHELLFVIEGEIHHDINGEKFIQKSGDLVFIREKDVHHFHTPQNFPYIKSRIVNIPFSFKWFSKLENLLEGNPSIPRLLALPQAARKTVPPNKWTYLMNGLNTLRCYISEEQAPLLISRFLIDCLDAMNSPDLVDQLFDAPQWFRKLVSELNEKNVINMTVQELASLVECSHEHLSRCFQRFLNTTPSQYLNDIRLKHAKYLLKQSNRCIYEISQECGYSDPAYFNRLFKYHYGMSPNIYRNQNSPNGLIFSSKL